MRPVRAQPGAALAGRTGPPRVNFILNFISGFHARHQGFSARPADWRVVFADLLAGYSGAAITSPVIAVKWPRFN
jgi:hypothetical protein